MKTKRDAGAGRLRARYGGAALVTGAAEGLGAAFARALEAEGMDLVLVDRKAAELERVAGEIAARSGRRPTTVVADLATRSGVAATIEAAERAEVGLLVLSAGIGLVGPFLDQSPEALDEVLRTNCGAAVRLCHALGGRMAQRGRGAILVVSSLSALQGTARVVTYAATKAFDLVFAEGLWDELGPLGVEVRAVCLGPTRTPGFLGSRPVLRGRFVPRVMEPDEVAAEALRSFEAPGPTAMVGLDNELAAALTSRLLPRRAAVRLVGRTMRSLYPRAR